MRSHYPVSNVTFLVNLEAISEFIRVFTYHISDPALSFKFFFPFFDTVRSLLLLQSSKDGLVLYCDLNELFSSLFAIKTFPGILLLLYRLCCSKGARLLLHDVRHLFE